MPELIFDTQEAVPEPIRSIAIEKDGKWAVNVVPKSELDDFRNRNVELARERDGQKTLLGRLQTEAGFDPEKIDEFVTEITDLRGIKQQVDDGKLVADSSLQQAVEAKTGEMRRTYEAKVSGLETQNRTLSAENEKLKTDLNRNRVEQHVMAAINDEKSGALPSATKHILREAHEIFTVDKETGEITAKDSKGNVIYGADGATVIQPLEWLKKLEETSPFFFKASQGGGAEGGARGGQTLTAAQLDAMSPEQKMDYGRQHGMNR